MPPAEADFITLDFYSAKGIDVGQVRADKPEPEEIHPDPEWVLLETLFTEVHRSVSGWDKVLNEIETALSGPGPVGQPAERGLTGTFPSTFGTSAK